MTNLVCHHENIHFRMLYQVNLGIHGQRRIEFLRIVMPVNCKGLDMIGTLRDFQGLSLAVHEISKIPMNDLKLSTELNIVLIDQHDPLVDLLLH